VSVFAKRKEDSSARLAYLTIYRRLEFSVTKTYRIAPKRERIEQKTNKR
jgi:hypothetical protein